MQKIYALSDIHGMIRPLRNRLSQLDMGAIRSGEAKLLFLGDYIDWGSNSFKVLETLFELQQDLKENVVVLKGNHEQWFLDFLSGYNLSWLGEMRTVSLLSAFLTDDELGRVNHLIARLKPHLANGIVRKAMETRHGDLLSWMKSLPLFYETEHQIFVHAGIDEEAGDLWRVGTDDATFMGKYPAEKGYFYKDIIAGHVSVSTASGRRNLHDIFFDQKSHFYIDGVDSYPASTRDDDRVIPLLLYTEEGRCGNYYSIQPDGTQKLLCSREYGTGQMDN